MAYSDSILEGKSPQYAYALVILSSGIAFIISQYDALISAWLFYALLAAVFASIWPYKAWQWAGWLCLPIILLICFDLLVTGSTYGLLRNGPTFAKVLPSACLGAYVGSKLSVHKIVNLFSHAPLHRKRLNCNENGARKSPVLKELTTPDAGIKAIFPIRNSNIAVQALEKRAPVQDLNAALIKAAQEGDADRIKLLVAQGADVNAQSSSQCTPLMIAALGGDVEIVQTLFGEGAGSDASGTKGWTALMIATIEGHAHVVRSLIEHGAEVNALNNQGWTALRFAVSMDETEILRVLLEAGADTNIIDHEGATALMQAAGENLHETLKTLLDAGADTHIRDHKEQTALMIARQRGHKRIIKLLKEAEAKASNDIHQSADILYDNSFLYMLKEELEENLNSRFNLPATSTAVAADEVASRLFSALQTVQEHIDATKKERSLAPSEVSHKLMLTLKEASALSGLPRRHLLEAIEARRLKARLIEHAWRIRRTELDDYIRRLS